MHYWNESNFKGLSNLARHFMGDPHLGLLGEYCRLRESGLRKQAFAALEGFLESSESWDVLTQRNVADQVLRRHHSVPEAHQFLSQPLLDKFLLPTLESWHRSQPDSVVPLRWLGLLTHNPEFLHRVLVHVPNDSYVRRRLFDLELSDVEYATHHLVEGRFFGELDDCRRALDRAGEILDGAPPEEPLADLVAEHAEYRQLLDDWEEYARDPVGSFPDWCHSRGRSYAWPRTIYYGDGVP